MKEFYQDVDFNGQTLLNFTIESLANLPPAADYGRMVINSATGDVMAYTGSWTNLSRPTINGAWLVLDIIGEISNAASNPAFPSNPTAGNTWLITSSGTVGGITVSPGDRLTYTSSGWVLLNDSSSSWSVISGATYLSRGRSYLLDLTSIAGSVYFPSSPLPGHWFRLLLYGNNSLTIGLSSSKYQGSSSAPSFPAGQVLTFVYLSATTGWVKG